MAPFDDPDVNSESNQITVSTSCLNKMFKYNPLGKYWIYHLDLNGSVAWNGSFFVFFPCWRCQPSSVHREREMHTTRTVYTQCDATALLDILIWIGGSERLHHSYLPCCPCHQFLLHGYGPEWHLVSCFLLSLLFLCTVNTSIVQELNVPVFVTVKLTCWWSDTKNAVLALPLNCTLSLRSGMFAVAFIISWLLEERIRCNLFIHRLLMVNETHLLHLPNSHTHCCFETV